MTHYPGAPAWPPRTVDVVVKAGGALLRDARQFATLVAAIDDLAQDAGHGACRTLVVPGGGPFADAVRDADRRLGAGDDAAHWMAILAMDQHAHLIAARAPGARMVTDEPSAAAALAAGCVPVLAPYRWLRRADPLPHSWSVTSDSVALWLAAALGALSLVLVKPIVGPLGAVADPYVAQLLAGGGAARAPVAVEVCRCDALIATVRRLARPLDQLDRRPDPGPHRPDGVSSSGPAQSADRSAPGV